MIILDRCRVTKMDLETKMEKQDASIKKMAKVLREGARMLDLACPECNNPIFQLKTGEKVCVVCERQVLLESEMPANEDQDGKASLEQSEGKDAEMESIPDLSVSIHDTSNSRSMIYSNLKQACIIKLALLTKKIQDCEDENAASLILSNTLKVLEIIEKLRLF